MRPGVGDERELRRHAIQIAVQLPEDEIEALMILDYAAELVRGFIEGRGTRADPPMLYSQRLTVVR